MGDLRPINGATSEISTGMRPRRKTKGFYNVATRFQSIYPNDFAVSRFINLLSTRALACRPCEGR